uniref:Uncharacterized protein n=1 Tax=Arundo donax TaxID=35708 RepID=A0A0A8YDX0_ARUDO
MARRGARPRRGDDATRRRSGDGASRRRSDGADWGTGRRRWRSGEGRWPSLG